MLNIAVKLTRLRLFKDFMAPLNLSRILSFTHFLIYYYPVILLLNYHDEAMQGRLFINRSVLLPHSCAAVMGT